MGVLATAVDTTPDVTEMVGGKTSSRLVKVHNHLVEVQSETFPATATATDATTTGGAPPYTPADNRCRGGEHAGVGYESSRISCPFALLREVMEYLQNGQFAAPAEGLRVNLEAESVAAPADNRCRGGEHTGVGYESSRISCPFALLREVTEYL